MFFQPERNSAEFKLFIQWSNTEFAVAEKGVRLTHIRKS